MKLSCPNKKCVLDKNLGPNLRQIVRNSSYFRKSDSRFIKRFYCRNCNSYFSRAKCKPLRVALAVEPKQRKIISFQVSQMPAKGKLAQVALRKYGPRKDKRPQGWERLMEDLKPHVKQDVVFTSDQNPHYPKHVYHHYPKATHHRVLGGRGAITGQGELKKLMFDPLFSLNHTCAMLRANLNRLFRKTWCTTKTVQGLIDHLSLYVLYHNLHLTPRLQHS
jgi:hypothetical protein